jgi:hypothetical protein
LTLHNGNRPLVTVLYHVRVQAVESPVGLAHVIEVLDECKRQKPEPLEPKLFRQADDFEAQTLSGTLVAPLQLVDLDGLGFTLTPRQLWLSCD